jgi:hypothetical protein
MTTPSQRRPVRAPIESFEDFLKALHAHKWSHSRNNYHDFIKAIKMEDELFSRAMQQSIPGLDAFRQAKEDSIMSIVDSAVRQAERSLVDHYQARIDALRAKFMTPLDIYKERLEQHDWHYDYSDDSRAYKAGTLAQHQLVLEAANRTTHDRQEFIDAYLDAHEAQHKRRPEWIKLLAMARADMVVNNVLKTETV